MRKKILMSLASATDASSVRSCATGVKAIGSRASLPGHLLVAVTLGNSFSRLSLLPHL